MGAVVFRTDASSSIGTGHIMRTLAMAEQMRRQHGASVFFVCRNEIGEMASLVTGYGFGLYLLHGSHDWNQIRDAEETIRIVTQHVIERIDLLVVDHYRLDALWEGIMRSVAAKILVIDDLADRMHDCDILLDQNLYKDMESRYEGLVPTHCVQLLGPKYALLRQEFIEAAREVNRDLRAAERCIIFFGGSDPTGETVKTLKAIGRGGFNPNLSFDVVVGKLNPQREEVERICREAGFRYHCQIDNMAELMLQADFMIGAGGTTSWERTLLQLPSITIVTADNQRQMTEMLDQLGVTCSLGWHSGVTEATIWESVERFLSKPAVLLEMSRNCAQVMAPDQTKGGWAHGTDWSFAFNGRS